MLTRSATSSRHRRLPGLVPVGAVAAAVLAVTGCSSAVAAQNPAATSPAGRTSGQTSGQAPEQAPAGTAAARMPAAEASPGASPTGEASPRASAPAKAPAEAPPAKAPAAAPVKLGPAPAVPAPGKRGRTDFAPYTSTFLGNAAGDEEATAVGIAPDGTVVVGGTVRSTLGRKAVALAGGGTGSVVRLDRTGRKVLSVSRLPGAVEDLDVSSRNGTIAAVGSFGLVVIKADGSRVLWRKAGCAGGGADNTTGRRVAVAENGVIATLCNKQVRVWTTSGTQLGSWKVTHQSVDDLAISSARRLVYVTGGNNLGQLRVAVVDGHTYAGKRSWRAYGWDRATIGPDVADTYGKRISLGLDGKVYLLGQSAGGNSIFSRDPQRPSAKAANATSDMFDTPYNTSDNNILYIARLDPATGKHLGGKYLLTRIDVKGNKGNTLHGTGVAADETGRVYVAGQAAYAIADRPKLTVCGKALPAYDGDQFVLQLSPDLRKRQIWTAIGGGGSGGAVAARAGVAAAALTPDSGKAVTCRPLAGMAKANASVGPKARDAFLTVWSAAKS